MNTPAEPRKERYLAGCRWDALRATAGKLRSVSDIGWRLKQGVTARPLEAKVWGSYSRIVGKAPVFLRCDSRLTPGSSAKGVWIWYPQATHADVPVQARSADTSLSWIRRSLQPENRDCGEWFDWSAIGTRPAPPGRRASLPPLSCRPTTWPSGQPARRNSELPPTGKDDGGRLFSVPCNGLFASSPVEHFEEIFVYCADGLAEGILKIVIIRLHGGRSSGTPGILRPPRRLFSDSFARAAAVAKRSACNP